MSGFLYVDLTKVEVPIVDHLSNFGADEEEYEVMKIVSM